MLSDASRDAFSPGLLDRIGKVRNIAIVRASRVGDFICATPALRALRVRLPDASFTLIGLPFVRELAVRSPRLDRFIPFGGFPGMAEQFFDPREAARFFTGAQARPYDLALQMHGTGVYSNTFTLMLGARVNAGFIRDGDGPGRLDGALAMPSEGREVNRLLAFTTFLGARPAGTETEFPIENEDQARADVLLADRKRPLIGVHAGARKPEKRWPAERFVVAARALRSRHGGTVIILGEDDGPGSDDGIARMIDAPCLDLRGKTTLAALGAVLNRLSLFLTNDSGPAHIAYALGCPTVTIFAETDPARWGPPASGPFRVVRKPLPCFPCAEGPCQSGYPCLRGITVEQVEEAAEQVIRA